MRKPNQPSSKRAPKRKPTAARTISEDDLKQVSGGGGKLASTRLMQACCTGKHLDKAILHV
jgi:bacteriocin-like protein